MRLRLGQPATNQLSYGAIENSEPSVSLLVSIHINSSGSSGNSVSDSVSEESFAARGLKTRSRVPYGEASSACCIAADSEWQSLSASCASSASISSQNT